MGNLGLKAAVLEERMETKQTAEYVAALERVERRAAERHAKLADSLEKRDAVLADRIAKLGAEALKRDADLKESMARRDVEAIDRENSMVKWTAGIVFAGVLLVVVILNIAGRLPGGL